MPMPGGHALPVLRDGLVFAQGVGLRRTPRNLGLPVPERALMTPMLDTVAYFCHI